MSDLQVPFYNDGIVKSVGRFLGKWKPHRTICIGDEIDLPQLGGFNANTIDEMVGNIHEDRQLTQEVLSYLGVTDVVGSNHGIRLYRSIKKRLPSFLNLPEMQYEHHKVSTGHQAGLQSMATLFPYLRYRAKQP